MLEIPTFLIILAAGVISFISMPLVIKIAYKLGAVDKPEARKVHQHTMPRLGGLAMYLSFMICIILFVGAQGPFTGLLLGASIVFSVGMLDDIFQLSPWVKLLGQCAAAVVAMYFGVVVEFLTNPFDGMLNLGGGTPSLLSPSELSLIINSINLNWDLDNEAEVSLEANPASLNGKALEFIHKAGFNRISLGVQSFQDRDLQILGRSHSSQEAWQSIELIKNSGFSNLNLDLIYGIPGQTIDKWQETLAQALDARPAHLSVYLLQLDEEVPLSRYIKAGHYQLCDEDTEAQMYQLAIQMIEKAGLFQYEISNFARLNSLAPSLLSPVNSPTLSAPKTMINSNRPNTNMALGLVIKLKVIATPLKKALMR
jgi:hypothetical protein